MNIFETECPACRQSMEIDLEGAKGAVQCPHCGVEIELCEGASEPMRSESREKEGVAEAPRSMAIPRVAVTGLALMVALAGWGPLFLSHEDRVIFPYSSAVFLLAGLMAVGSMTALFIGILQPKRVDGAHALGIFLFTAIPGIIGLLLLQKLGSMAAHGKWMYAGPATPWYFILKFYGQCWEWVDGPFPFWKRAVGQIFAVGLYEELTKLIPLLALLAFTRRGPRQPQVRAFIFLGFLSGIAFGTSEALLQYAPWVTPLSTEPLILGMPFPAATIRWFSSVTLHGIWGAVDAACLWAIAPVIFARKWWIAKFGLLVTAASLIAVVHGIYNTAVTLVSSSVLGAGVAIGSACLLPLLCGKLATVYEHRSVENTSPGHSLDRYFRRPLAWLGIVGSTAGGVFVLFLSAEPIVPRIAQNEHSSAPSPGIPGLDPVPPSLPPTPVENPIPTREIVIPALTAVRCDSCDGEGPCPRCGGVGFVIAVGK